MYITKKIIGNIPVTLVKTDKFKSTCGSLFFKMPINKDSLTKRNLIRTILIHSCKKYSTNRLLNINCLENYDAFYSSTLRREGNYIINFFTFNVLDDEYTIKGNLNNVLDTFYEIIFNPNAKNNKFDEEEFNLAKDTLKASLEREKENARVYANGKLNDQMGNNLPISYKATLDILNKISNEDLYKEYLNMIENSEIEFIIAGKNICDLNLDKLLINVKNTKYDKSLKINARINEFNSTIEDYDGLQSILTVGLKLRDLTEFESTYVLPVFNNILGGGASSRLFDTIREKNSLAYSCFSRYEKDDNLIQIFAGIENDNYEKALSLIKEEVEKMNKITKDELKRSITDITSSIIGCLDEIINYVIPIYVSGLYNEENILDKIEKIKQVNVEDVEKVKEKIFTTDSFFLKGGKTSE